MGYSPWGHQETGLSTHTHFREGEAEMSGGHEIKGQALKQQRGGSLAWDTSLKRKWDSVGDVSEMSCRG